MLHYRHMPSSRKHTQSWMPTAEQTAEHLEWIERSTVEDYALSEVLGAQILAEMELSDAVRCENSHAA